MDFDFKHDDIDKIKKSYIYKDKDITEPTIINTYLDLIFESRIICYKIPEKLNDLKTRINGHKGENCEKMKKYEDRDNELMNQYNDIIKEQKQENFYYWELLSCFKYNKDKGPTNLFNNASQEILDMRLKSCIEKEKNIILINDEIKQLFEHNF